MLVAHLFAHNILVTGLNYPIVPKGDEEIRLQVSATPTEQDIDYLFRSIKKLSWVFPSFERVAEAFVTQACRLTTPAFLHHWPAG